MRERALEQEEQAQMTESWDPQTAELPRTWGMERKIERGMEWTIERGMERKMEWGTEWWERWAD